MLVIPICGHISHSIEESNDQFCYQYSGVLSFEYPNVLSNSFKLVEELRYLALYFFFKYILSFFFFLVYPLFGFLILIPYQNAIIKTKLM